MSNREKHKYSIFLNRKRKEANNAPYNMCQCRKPTLRGEQPSMFHCHSYYDWLSTPSFFRNHYYSSMTSAVCASSVWALRSCRQPCVYPQTVTHQCAARQLLETSTARSLRLQHVWSVNVSLYCWTRESFYSTELWMCFFPTPYSLSSDGNNDSSRMNLSCSVKDIEEESVYVCALPTTV